ncbi:hypothetical protein GUJ93_ZPchr0013g34949 [Zizania palustris]|uniref:Acidic leucine-rich nuclear phosphoprotein 32-related protein n=1 Tax=Zizania palustris TaxID=103762 RepID=A0A8J6C0Y6_ZIZPA|nr:hypothetical protein GUJ93_ZPchr0013g34949 [Zizania palustris]
MDEAWERAVEAALQADGEGSSSPARSLTLDGAVKCLHGRLPAAEILERHQSLEHLSIAGVGVASLAGFPRLRNLTRLTLSDNRIAGGLDHLVAAGLGSLRDLDLSNNRIQDVDDLAPLADLRLVSLDLYECPVTRVKDYRSKVFGMIPTLRYLDKMDADENERLESDDDDDDDGDGEDEEEEEEEEEDDDPGSGEVANGGVSHSRGGAAAHPLEVEVNGVIDVDEDESDADEVELPNGVTEHHYLTNGFRIEAVVVAPDEDENLEEEEDDDEDDYLVEEEDLGEEIDEEGDDDDAVVEVHDVPSSDEEEDAIDEDDDDEEEDEEDDGEEAEPESSGRVAMAVGDVGEEIDGHEQGEGEDEDENGEIGEEDGERLEDDRVYEEGNDGDDVDDEV